eukprot:1160437-Pelagomonas_calceolata.AAC.7
MGRRLCVFPFNMLMQGATVAAAAALANGSSNPDPGCAGPSSHSPPAAQPDTTSTDLAAPASHPAASNAPHTLGGEAALPPYQEHQQQGSSAPTPATTAAAGAAGTAPRSTTQQPAGPPTAQPTCSNAPQGAGMAAEALPGAASGRPPSPQASPRAADKHIGGSNVLMLRASMAVLHSQGSRTERRPDIESKHGCAAFQIEKKKRLHKPVPAVCIMDMPHAPMHRHAHQAAPCERVACMEVHAFAACCTCWGCSCFLEKKGYMNPECSLIRLHVKGSSVDTGWDVCRTNPNSNALFVGAKGKHDSTLERPGRVFPGICSGQDALLSNLKIVLSGADDTHCTVLSSACYANCCHEREMQATSIAECCPQHAMQTTGTTLSSGSHSRYVI